MLLFITNICAFPFFLKTLTKEITLHQANIDNLESALEEHATQYKSTEFSDLVKDAAILKNKCDATTTKCVKVW